MTIVVTEAQMATLRAYLAGDQDEYDRLIKGLERTGELDGFSALFGAAFFDAVLRRFAPTWTVAEVIRFVATVRAHHLKDPSQLDPLDAERLIRTALGDGSPDDLNDGIRSAQMILLPALISEEEPSHIALDDILAQARRRANSLPL